MWAQTDKLLVTHHPDPTKSRGQYLDLLAVSVKEDPRCPRNAFYYARELTFYAKWHEAIAALIKYLAMPEATWPNERCYAYRLLGKCYAELGDYGNAESYFLRACSEAPNTREPWCELAMLYYRQSRWAECDPAVWGDWPHDLAAISAHHLGMRDAAIRHGEAAVELSPTNKRLADNLNYYRGLINGD